MRYGVILSDEKTGAVCNAATTSITGGAASLLYAWDVETAWVVGIQCKVAAGSLIGTLSLYSYDFPDAVFADCVKEADLAPVLNNIFPRSPTAKILNPSHKFLGLGCSAFTSGTSVIAATLVTRGFQG